MKTLFFLGLLVLPVSIVQAQNAAVEALPSFLQSQVVDSDPLMDFRTQNVPQGRVDRDTGVLRAAYRLSPTVLLRATHEATARAYLDAEAERFGWATADDLLLIREMDGHYSAHLTFQQTFGGIPVHNRFVKVSMGPSGHPSMVLSGYAPHLREADPVRLQPLLDASGAVRRAQQETLAQRVSTPELVVYPSTPPRLAWRMIALPDGILAEWEVLMDADTGEILYLVNQVTHMHASSSAPARSASSAPAESASVPAAHAVVDGTGLVFDPDPLTTAGVQYGGAYVDNDDADVDELNAERKEVVLRDITMDSAGRHYLIGPYVEITGSPQIGGTAWTPPAETDPDVFRYGRANDFFEAVMVYYHIDQSQRYVQSLNVGRPIREDPIRAHPHGLGDVNDSSYSPFLHAIAFGDGGIDDAEDADVILHEYGHALLEGSAPGLIGGGAEGSALHEGWSDYWAVSYSRWLAESVMMLTDQEWRKIFNWVGNGEWTGRRLDATGTYPEDTECDNDSECDVYEDGRLWATTLMEIYDDLGRSVTDRLNLASHAYLSPPATFVDAAEALIQADAVLYDGQYRDILAQRLSARGFLDDESALLIDSIMADENDTGGYTITAAVRPNMGAPVTSVVLHYGDGMTFEMAPMQMSSGGSYTAELMAPAEGGILYYYVLATNGDGLTATYPLDGRYRDISDYTEGSRLVFLDFEDEDAGDKSDVGHHVAHKGGTPMFAEGALALDGLDDHAEILGSSLGASEEFALEIMFNADDFGTRPSDTGGRYFVVKPARCSTCWEESTFSLLWGDDSGNSGTYVAAHFWNPEYEGEQVELEVPLSLASGQWYHAVLQVQKEDALQRAILQLRDRSGQLYGEDAAVLPASPAISTHPIFVGRTGDRGFFGGRIDDVAFYNYAHFDLSSTSVENTREVPEGYVLEQNYPNPFNPVTTIRYDLAVAGHVSLEVSDLLGRRVALLVNGVQEAGVHQMRFDARALPSGMYLYRLRVEDFVSVKKMVLLK